MTSLNDFEIESQILKFFLFFAFIAQNIKNLEDSRSDDKRNTKPEKKDG